jgi:hypothetical protein
MLGVSLGHRMREQWSAVLGKDGLTHWHCAMVDPFAHGVSYVTTIDDDETTYCGQTFFERMPLPPSTVVITCLECCARHHE